MKTTTKEKIFLMSCAIGLTPIALSYGVKPDVSLPYLFNIAASDVNSKHIFRAMTGLYLAMIGLWWVAAVKEKYREIALYALAVFMLGLAFGRIVSLLLDGIPHWLLLVYAALEIQSGFNAIMFLRKRAKENQA